jgi:hypothetical protein
MSQNNKRKLQYEEVNRRVKLLFNGDAKITLEDAREVVQTLEEQISETLPDLTLLLSKETMLEIFCSLPPTQFKVLPLVCKRFAEIYEIMEPERFRSSLDKNGYAIRAAMLLYMLEEDLVSSLRFNLSVSVFWANYNSDEGLMNADFEVLIDHREDGNYSITWEETTTYTERDLNHLLEEMGYKEQDKDYLKKEEIFRFLRNMFDPNHDQSYKWKYLDEWGALKSGVNRGGFSIDNTEDTLSFYFGERGCGNHPDEKRRIQRFAKLEPNHPIRELFNGFVKEISDLVPQEKGDIESIAKIHNCWWIYASKWLLQDFNDYSRESLRIIREMFKKTLPNVKLW